MRIVCTSLSVHCYPTQTLQKMLKHVYKEQNIKKKKKKVCFIFTTVWIYSSIFKKGKAFLPYWIAL